MFPQLSATEIQDNFIDINPEENESDYIVQTAANIRYCQKLAEEKESYDRMVIGALEVAQAVNPFLSDLPYGEVVPTVDAVDWFKGQRNCDIRPRLKDDSTGTFRLIDSGSMITATMKGPGDVIDDNVRLIAVNGSRIPTYGTKTISFKIGRKTYSMEAIICDIGQDILGMDFLKKYRLSLDWDDLDQSELFLVDKKANISKRLEMVTVPTDLQRVHYLEDESGPSGCAPSSSLTPSVPSPESVAFQVACVQELSVKSDKKKEEKKKTLEESLRLHDPKYVELLRKYPQLLNPNFVKGEPVHGVYHKIEVGSSSPCRSKRRPVIANAEKAEIGRKAWEQMAEDGIIERVQAGSNTDWTSSLHLVTKAPQEGGPGVRCFRQRQYRTLSGSVTYTFQQLLFNDFL